MAKIKVHEIAKELGKQSKEVIAFLQNKGIEVKAAQSSLEAEVADMVRKTFGRGEKTAGTETAIKAGAAAEAKPAKETEGKKEEKKPVEENQSAGTKKTTVEVNGAANGEKGVEKSLQAREKKEGKAGQNGTEQPKTGEQPKAKELKPVEPKPVEPKPVEPVKKKKKIIFVSNPHNSNIMSQRANQGERRPAQGERRPAQGERRQQQGNKSGGANRQGQGKPQQEAPHKIIRPLTAPSLPESMNVDFKQNVRKMENERIAAKNAAVKAQKAAEAEAAAKEAAVRAAEMEAEAVAAAEKVTQATAGSGANVSANTKSGASSNGVSGTGASSFEGTNVSANRRADGTAQTGNQANRPARKTGERSGDRPAHAGRDNNNTKTAGARDERRQRNERSQGNFGSGQGERNNRNDSRRFDGSNRDRNQGGRNDFRGNGPDKNGTRFGNNNNRSERGGQGQEGRFKRSEKPGKGFSVDAPVKEEKRRDEEKRRIGQEKDRRSKKDFIYEEDEAVVKNKNKAGRFIKPEKKVEEKIEEQIKVIVIPESLTIKELADKMKMQPSAIIKKLFLQGRIVTVNSEIPFEDAENIAIEYDIICEKEKKVDVIEELLKEEDEETEKMMSRPPVICVMGHVDHGKTSLLDAIRKTNVTDKEAGGITQHIGAYTVNVNDQSITFLDTPGHEAFTAMRMRGANSTDIAILVVAADDGVMPQTVEAINHAKAAGTEIIVAVNKIDKPGANVDRVKQEMTEYELIPVDWGGSTEFVPVSAKSGEGIDTLLETILLTAEIMELRANPDRRARGLVIEAELDKGRGPVATVLVQKGTLHVGDFISAGASHGKVRAMIDDKGRRVKEALPSTPVEILGLSDVPSAGEVFIAHENDKTAKSYAETYLAQNKEKMLEETKAKMSLDDLFSQIQAGNLKELNIIVKADVQGSVEAVKQSLMKLSNEEVVVKCIHGGVGAINESDVSLASASSAIIIGFNVRPDAMAKTIAEREGVDIRLYKVIYQAIEDIEAAMKGMLDPIFEEKVIGHAEVRQIFKASAVGNIAGSYVLDGTFQRDCKIRISREGNQIYEGSLASLKRFKDDVKEVRAGFECGLVFEGFDQMQELDIVEAYIMVEVPR